MDNNNFYRCATEALMSSLNIEEALQNCLNCVSDVIPGDVLSVHLWEEELYSLRILSAANLLQGHICNMLIPVEENSRYIPRWNDHNPIKIINDYRDDPISIHVQDQLATLFGDEHYSHLILRVTIKEKRICDVVLLAKGFNRFTDEHAALFAMLQSPFGIAVSNGLQHLATKDMHARLLSEHLRLKGEFKGFNHHHIIGSRSGLSNTMRTVEEVARTTAPVLITGETGVGKDVIATAIQRNSLRSDKPFVLVNCGAIPESLLDSELFGHEKGSFTGAHERKMGRFERAEGGTIFLDEVGELSMAAQVRLLRVLQNGEIERIGSKSTIKLDVRVVAATNRPLKEMVDKKEFRADLYYRLCLFPIKVPALRDRLEDIPLFADYFIRECAQKLDIPLPGIEEGEIEKLQQYSWPGNVRELSNVIERSVISSRGKKVRFDIEMQYEPKMAPPQPSYQELEESVEPEDRILTLEELNRKHIEEVLTLTQGKIQGEDGAAKLLDINPHTLRSRIKKLGIMM